MRSDREHVADLMRLWNITNAANVEPRVVAIVCTAYIENHIGALLFEKMPALTPHLKKAIFGDTGPLAAIGDKIDVALALGCINETLAADAKRIAKIRNKFAHTITVDHFDHEKVRDVVDQLQTGRGVIARYEDGSESEYGKDWTRTERFRAAALGVCAQIMHLQIPDHEYPLIFTAEK